MRAWFKRQRLGTDEPMIHQVDRLIETEPRRLEIPIAALPGGHDELLAAYRRAFRQRGYVLEEVTHDSPELWTAIFQRRPSTRSKGRT